MAKIRIDKLVGGNAVWHEHGAEDIPELSAYVPYTGSTGNVQLGTHDLLASRLDIGGAGEFGNIRQVRIHNDAAYSGLRITNATTGVGSNKGFEMSTYNHDGILNLYEDGDMRFYVHNVERMVLDNVGNLDIDGDYSGVDVNITGDIYLDDTKRINIGNSNDFQLTHSGSVSYIKSIISNYDLAISVNDGGVTKYPIWIDASTSSLGIWNTSPIYPLDVAGVIHGNSNILANGNFGSNVLEPTFPFESVSKDNFASGTIINKTDPKEVLEMRRARGAIEEPEDTVGGDILSLINSWGYYNSDWRHTSKIRTEQYSTWGEGDYAARMYFGVTQVGGGEPQDIAFISERGGFNPAEDSSFTLGTGDLKWDEVYANTYYGDGSALTGIYDRKVGVDSSATPDYIGSSSSNGVLRVGSDLTYADGGNYVTINVADNFLRNTGDTATGDYAFNADTLFIDSVNEKVGVGTNTPSEVLEVSGNILADGTIPTILANRGILSNNPEFNRAEITTVNGEMVGNPGFGNNAILIDEATALQLDSGDNFEWVTGNNAGYVSTIGALLAPPAFDPVLWLLATSTTPPGTNVIGDTFKSVNTTYPYPPFTKVGDFMPSSSGSYSTGIFLIATNKNIIPSILPEGDLDFGKYGIYVTSGVSKGLVAMIKSTVINGSSYELNLYQNPEFTAFNQDDGFDIIDMENKMTVDTYNLNVRGFTKFENEVSMTLLKPEFILGRPVSEFGKTSILASDGDSIALSTTLVVEKETSINETISASSLILLDYDFTKDVNGVSSKLRTSGWTGTAPRLNAFLAQTSFFDSITSLTDEINFYIADLDIDTSSGIPATDMYVFHSKGLNNYTNAVNRYAFFSDGGMSELQSGQADILPLTIKGFTSQTANLQNWTDINDNVLASISSEGSISVKGVTKAYAAKTANYTLTDTDYQIECTANSFTVTLPTAVGIEGRVYSIKNTGTGIITVDGNGTETIDGELTQLLTQWDNIKLMSNDANWIII